MPIPDVVGKTMKKLSVESCSKLIEVVKDDVACVGVDLLVVSRKTARQVGHLLETAVVVHVEREVALGKEFDEGLGRGIFFERCREGGVVHMDFEFHGSLPHF